VQIRCESAQLCANTAMPSTRIPNCPNLPPPMSYDMSFKGRFDYPSHEAARAAVGAFARSECIEESVVRPEDLQVNERSILLDVDASAPATWWESTCDALSTLSEEASDGSVEAIYDNEYRVRLLPGGGEEELDGA
jgi:hypothetical protein